MPRLIDQGDGTAVCWRGHRTVPYLHVRRSGTLQRTCRECQMTKTEQRDHGLTFEQTAARRERRRAERAAEPLCATCGDRGRLSDGAACPDCAEARAG